MTDAPRSRSVTRAELHEMIWTKPVRTVAAELGLSDVGLAKICKRLEVPRPGPSYWGRIRHGQTPERVPLPPRKGDIPEQIEIRPRSISIKEAHMEHTLAVPVPTSLEEPHSAVRAIQKVLRGAKPNVEGLVLITGKEEHVLRVSPTGLDRALLIYDGLFKALEGRGHKVSLGEIKEQYFTRHPLEAIVEGTHIELSLTERLRRSDHVPTPKEAAAEARESFAFAPRYDFAPSGELTLLIGGRHGVGHQSWTDGKRHKVEEVLGAIVVGLEEASRAIVENDRRNEEYRRRSERAMRIRYKEEALKKDLDQMVSRWAEATKLRAFLAAVGQGVPEPLRATEGFAAWLAWAKAEADALDPLSAPEQIAKVVDPELMSRG